MLRSVLGVGFLQQGRPELVWVFGVNENETSIDRWQFVINDDVHPSPKPPELKEERWFNERPLRELQCPVCLLI